MLDQFKKCLFLTDRATAWQGTAIAVLVLLSALLEAFGIGLIYGFVQVLVDPSKIQQMAWLEKIAGPGLAESEVRFLSFLALSLLCVFILKNLALLGFYFVQARFVAVNEALIASRLLDSYLKGAYALHLTRNSADFIRTLTGSITTVFSTVIMGFIGLAAEFVVIAAMATVLLLLEPMLSLGAALGMVLTVSIFFFFSKPRFMRWGKQEQETNGKILQALQQGFHNIKEVKVLGCQPFILKTFEEPRRALAGTRIKIGTMAQAPRLWVESVIVTAVLLAVVYALSNNNDSAKILSVLTIFAAAAFRMIPSMNRILNSLNNIKNGSHALNLVYDDFREFKNNPDEKDADNDERTTITFRETLSVEGLSFSYAEGDGPVLEDISLTLPKGGSLGLVGSSGAGKTTFVDILLGLLVPISGRVAVDGVDISGSLHAWRRQIGYVPQSIYIIDDTLRRNVAFGLNDDEIDDEKVGNAIRLAQLEDFVRKLPHGLDTPMGERGVRLSGGQRQRVGIARALYREPELLILDEATSSLDTETEHEINNAIESLSGQKTLIIIAHRLSTVRKCQSLAFLKDGRLIDTGTFDELNARNADFGRMVELSRL